MTTDPFTEAARAEAEELTGPPVAGETSWDYRYLFEAGAEWARNHLTAQEGHRRVRKYADDWDTCTCGYDAWPCRSQEPTDAEVEAAARTWAESGPTAAVWEQMAEERREYTRERMHACLSAARAARRDEEKR